MKKIIIFAFTIISIALAGCAKEEAQLDNKELSVLKANVEATDLTRVGFTKEGTKWSFFWHKKDQIWVNKGVMSTEDNTGTKAASFTGYGVNTTNGYAVYPFAKAENKVSNDGVLTWNFPDTYEYTSIDETFFNTAQEVPMYAVVSNGSASFKHLAAICAFKFNGWSHTGKHRFELHTSKKITGDFNVDLKSETPTIVTETVETDRVTVTYDRPANAGEGSIVFYVPVPTGTYDLNIKVYVDDILKFTQSASNVQVKRADIVSSEFGKSIIIGGEGTPVATEEEFMAALANGSINNITLADDLTFSEIVTINRSVTIDGNGKKLTSTAGRAINVSGANGVTIKNLTIEASGERAINIIQNATNVTIDKVTATATLYTVNVASSAPAAKVTISNSTLTGLNVVNVSGADAEVTVTDCTINCNDNNETKGESYAALCLNKDAIGGQIIATGCTINITEGSDSEKGRNGAENGIVTINGSTEGVSVKVAAITFEGTDNYYAFNTLAEAIEFAETGSTIILIRDIELTEGLTIPTGKTITLDLNGKTISQEKECTGSYSMFTNNGKLTITGNGTISFKDLSNGGSSEWGSYIINNLGTLVVENGKLEHLGTAENDFDTCIPIQNYAGKVVVNGGRISSPQFRSLRDFTAGGEIIINGGEFNGQIWMQGLGTGSSSLTINGGSFGPTANDGSSVFITNGTNDVQISVTGGTFNTKIGCTDASKSGVKGSVSGGTFTEAAKQYTNASLIADGYEYKDNQDGTYSIVKK